MLISSLLISALLLSGEAEAASVRITSTVAPLFVHVDGQLRGQTPVVVDLGAGSHKIEVRQSADDMMSVVEFIDVGSEASGTLSFDWNGERGKLTWGAASTSSASSSAARAESAAASNAARDKVEADEERRRAAEAAVQKRLEEAEIAKIMAEEGAKKRAEVEADRRRQAEEVARKRMEDAEVARILAEEDARARAEAKRVAAEEAAAAKRLAEEEAVRAKAEAAAAKRLAAEEAGRAKAEAGARAREEEARKRDARDAGKRAEAEAVAAERAAREEERRLVDAASEQDLRDAARGRVRMEFTIGTFDARLTIRVLPRADAPVEIQSRHTVSLPLGSAEAVATFRGKSVRWKLEITENEGVDAAISDILAGRAPARGPVTVQTEAPFPLPTAALLSIGDAEPLAFLAEPGERLQVEAELDVPLRPPVTAPLAALVRAGPGTVVSWTVDPALHPAIPLRAELSKVEAKRRAHSVVSLGGLGVAAGGLLVSAIEFGASQAAYTRMVSASGSQEEFEQDAAIFTGARSAGIASLVASGVAIGFAGVWEFGLGGKGRANVADTRAEFEDALRSPVSPRDIGETEGGGPDVEYRSYSGASGGSDPEKKSSFDEKKPRENPVREKPAREAREGEEKPESEDAPESEDEPDREDEPDFEEDSEEEPAEEPVPAERDTEETPDFGEEPAEDAKAKKRGSADKKSGSAKRSGAKDSQPADEEERPEEGLPEDEEE